MNKKTAMEEVYEKRLKEVQEMDVNDENYAKAVDCVAKMADRVIEEKRSKGDRVARWFKDGADTAIKIASLATSVAVGIVCLRYEDKGVITTSVGKKLFDKLLKG